MILYSQEPPKLHLPGRESVSTGTFRTPLPTITLPMRREIPAQLPPGSDPGTPVTVAPRTIRVERATLPPSAEEEKQPAKQKPRLTPLGFSPHSSFAKRRSLRHRNWSLGRQILVGLVALLLGYVLGWRHGRPIATGDSNRSPIVAPTATEQQELDAAFAALKSTRYPEARARFSALTRKYPKWNLLDAKTAVAALDGEDGWNFEKLITQGEAHGVIPSADARFLLGQMYMGTKEYEDADRLLGEAAGADPSRAETYLVWGDCLLRWGRLNEAVEKFRAAQLRNPDPTAENVYETKLWLAEVESGLETTDGTAAQIDRALAQEQPTSSARFAGAARALKAGRFDQAADGLAKARQVAEPAMFRVVLQDPHFSAESWRPEFASLYAGASQGEPRPAMLAQQSPDAAQNP